MSILMRVWWKNAKVRGIHTYRVDLNYDKLLFPENLFFDYVTISDVLEHIVFIDHCLKEIYRVCLLCPT